MGIPIRVVTRLKQLILLMHKLYIEPQCPVGSYEEDLSTGENVCVPCPDNSLSTTEGSKECTCFEGYFRAVLEEPNYPCTREILKVISQCLYYAKIHPITYYAKICCSILFSCSVSLFCLLNV